MLSILFDSNVGHFFSCTDPIAPLISSGRTLYPGVTKVNALIDGYKILKGMFLLWIKI